MNTSNRNIGTPSLQDNQFSDFLSPTPVNPKNTQLQYSTLDILRTPSSPYFEPSIHNQSGIYKNIFANGQSPAYPSHTRYYNSSTPGMRNPDYNNQLNNSILSAAPNNGTPYQPNINDMKLQTNKIGNTNDNNIMGNNVNSVYGSVTYRNNIVEQNSENISTANSKPSSYGIVSVNDEEILPKLQNIVSTANLKSELDLRDIALRAKNAEYNPKRFAAVIMRIKEPKTTALIFASGKMVCTGARSEEDSRKAARQYAKIIQKLGYPVKFSEFKIQNIVGSCDVKFKISLSGLNIYHDKFSSYEPELFPGLIYKMYKPKIVLLIFASGKIVLTGAKEKNEIFEAFKNIYPILQKYRNENHYS